MKWFAVEKRGGGQGARVAYHLPDSAHKLQNLPKMTAKRDMKPMRWLAHLPLAILPLLAAAAIEGRRLEPALERRVNASLATAGQDWAKPIADGRDIEIRGEAPNRAAIDAARRAAAATFGVRRVVMHAGTMGP